MKIGKAKRRPKSKTNRASNRLTEIRASNNKRIGVYEYDGLNRRTVKKEYDKATDQLIKTRHFYYSNQWQVLEERIDTATTADQQFVWGMRYVDDLVLRDKGSERLYSLQDALFNIVALADTSGSVKVSCLSWNWNSDCVGLAIE